MKQRKDRKGRVLRNNESQMPDGRYRFRYTTSRGKRKAVYSWRLTSHDTVPPGKRPCACLRDLESQILQDRMQVLDHSLADTTVNEMFARYLEVKPHLKENMKKAPESIQDPGAFGLKMG